MNSYSALEMDLEKSLKEDRDGVFLQALQKSLADYAYAIERHISIGHSSEEFARWKNLQAAVESASVVSDKLRKILLDT